MNANINLPDFLIIGAQKAGTTALYFYCKQHPDIFMPVTKEPMFFSSKQIPDAPVDKSKTNLKAPYSFFTMAEYATLFEEAGQNQMIGEASTSYLANPDSALWIKKIIPNVKLIVIVRNPLERAFSAFKMYTKRGVENRSFEEAITAGLEHGETAFNQGQRYLSLGLYASQLASFASIFPKEQIFIGDYDEYNRNNLAFLQKIFRFLQVKEFVPENRKRLLVSDVTPESSKPGGLIEEKMKSFFKKDVALLQTMVDFDVTKWIT